MTDPVYPLTFPAAIKAKCATVAPSLRFITANTKSPYTLTRQAFRWGGEAWTFEYNVAVMTRADAEEWIAFANKLRGKYGSFLLGDFSAGTPRGVGGGTPLVKGAAQPLDYLLEIDGCGNNVTGWLLKGDYFQLGTGSDARLYKLTENVDSDGSGNATLNFVPKLRAVPADNAALVITNAVGRFNLTENVVAWSVDQAGHYRLSFRAEEAL